MEYYRFCGNAASTNVTALASYCTAQAAIAQNTLDQDQETSNGGYYSTDPSTLTSFISTANAQAATAQTALTNEITPVLTQVSNATTVVANANAMVQKVQNEQNSPSDTSGTTYTNDEIALQTMPPTGTDVANAMQNAQSFGMASANPTGSLNVSGSSLVDQMNLLSTNATALKASCTVPSVSSVFLLICENSFPFRSSHSRSSSV